MEAGSREEQDRVLARLDQAIRANARTEAPPAEERVAWLFGNVGWTDPDEHGWIAPTLPDLWIPRALCFWHAAISTGGAINREQMRNPAHALHPWPEIEETVGDYLLKSPWLVASD